MKISYTYSSVETEIRLPIIVLLSSYSSSLAGLDNTVEEMDLCKSAFRWVVVSDIARILCYSQSYCSLRMK